MRVQVKRILKVRAISGTYVVFLAFDLAESDAKGLMGFAIRRTDVARQETEFLRGIKTFESTRPADGIDEVRSLEHPFQAFQWADYAVKPGQEYEYEVMAMYGKPENLVARYQVRVKIKTEEVDDGRHAVHFNRGAIASQEYTRRFQGLPPSQVGEPAYAWLGRDLVPGLMSFIERAKDSSYELHVAIYEIGIKKPLEALAAAKARGVKVHIVYHAKEGDDQTQKNIDELTGAGLIDDAVGRVNVNLMHNKFIVLSRDGKPLAVWTGSTNWSVNAFYGQLNVGHAVTDARTAKAFLGYWKALESDIAIQDMRAWMDSNNQVPPDEPLRAIEPMFSPRSGKSMMTWWTELANTGQPLFMTFPFGMAKEFQAVYDQNDGVLRFALLDKFGNGGAAAAAEAALTLIRKLPNVGLSVAPRGKGTLVHRFDGWQKEVFAIGVNVNWIHTKFMLVDPLGPAPTTMTGSANWSTNSVSANDENMLAIFGDTRVADIYFGEFMRMFGHHRFRESVAWHFEAKGADSKEPWKPNNLFSDWRKWVPEHFRPGGEKDIKRRYFAGV